MLKRWDANPITLVLFNHFLMLMFTFSKITKFNSFNRLQFTIFQVFDMYKKYSGSKRWSFDMLSESVNAEGGLKEASASISGNSVFAFLKVCRINSNSRMSHLK